MQILSTVAKFKDSRRMSSGYYIISERTQIPNLVKQYPSIYGRRLFGAGIFYCVRFIKQVVTIMLHLILRK